MGKDEREPLRFGTQAQENDQSLLESPGESFLDLMVPSYPHKALNTCHLQRDSNSRSLAAGYCSALVDTLLESQLFGHMRGSFTGATDTRPGLFEYANGGTVFLDEIGETSLSMQAKLLRVIQNREVQRVGSPEVRQVTVRLIAATNRNLRAEVLAGRFREDLYYRLSSIQIRIPSLAERLEDIPLLMQFFLKKYNGAYGRKISGLTRRAQTEMLQHSRPGNAQELENVISSACIKATGEFIDLGDLPNNFSEEAICIRMEKSGGRFRWMKFARSTFKGSGRVQG